MQDEIKPTIFPILLVNFIGTLGYSVVLPFLVVLVLNFGGNELIYGIMGATYSFFQLIGAPILGGWSDKIGRRKVLLISQAGTFLAWVIFLIALLLPNIEITGVDSSLTGSFLVTIPLILLFVARALDGITGGNVSVANAYLADITTESDRKKNFGKMAASGNMGLIVGPAFAGLLGATILGELLPVIMAMLISLIAIGVIFYQLKDSKASQFIKTDDNLKNRKLLGLEHKECYKMEEEGSSLTSIMRIPHVPFILFLYFLIFLAFNFFYVSFPIHAVQQLDWSLFYLGIFFSAMSGLMVFFQGPVLTFFSKKYNDATLVVAGSIVLSLGFLFFVSADIWVLFVGLSLFSFGNGIMWPSFLSILSRVAGNEFQGAVQGYASSVGSFASILGLLGGGIVYGKIDVYIFVLPAAIMAFLFFASFKLLKMETKSFS